MKKVIFNSSPKTYYVATTGNNSSDGLTTGTAWATLTYAVSIASPITAGDTIYVKAGNYGAENVIFQKSGTTGAFINIIGYKTTPGDQPPLLINNGNPYTAYVTTDMPTYDGGNRATGTGFLLDDIQFINLKNFQITNYAVGLTLGSASQTTNNYINLYNVNGMTFGDTANSYSGQGIILGAMGVKFANKNTLTNCLVVNCSAEGIGTNGNNNTITGCKVYCNEDSTIYASTDYYFYICGDYNIITNCWAERFAGIYHTGHGFNIKSNAGQVVDAGLPYPVLNCKYNQINYCTAVNMQGEAFAVRHRLVQMNTFYKCSAIGTYAGTYLGSSGEGTCVVVRDGANNNIFDSCTGTNLANAITFVDSTEDGDTGGSPPGHPSNYNLIINCVFNQCYTGIDTGNNGISVGDAGANTIANCTFYKCDYMHFAARHCASLSYINNIYSGSRGYFRGNTYSADVVVGQFTNCNFYSMTGLPGGFVAGTNIGSDPLFISTAASNFHLGASSPCKDVGSVINYNPRDFDGVLRPIGSAYSMGAFER